MSDALFRAHERVEAAMRELDAARHDLMQAVVEANASQRERWEETRRAIQDNDEAVTGTPCCDPRPIAPGLEGRTHQFAAIQCSGGVCSEAMDDLDGEGP